MKFLGNITLDIIKSHKKPGFLSRLTTSGGSFKLTPFPGALRLKVTVLMLIFWNVRHFSSTKTCKISEIKSIAKPSNTYVLNKVKDPL